MSWLCAPSSENIGGFWNNVISIDHIFEGGFKCETKEGRANEISVTTDCAAIYYKLTIESKANRRKFL